MGYGLCINLTKDMVIILQKHVDLHISNILQITYTKNQKVTANASFSSTKFQTAPSNKKTLDTKNTAIDKNI